MGAEVIAVSHIQSSGPTFRREAYELFELMGALDYSDRKPYFTFDVRIPRDGVAAVTDAIRTALDPEAAEELIAFLESMDWEASFVYLG